MLKYNKEILDKLLPSVINKTITKKNKMLYEDLLEKEWERLRLQKLELLKYYPHAVYGN